MNQVAASPKPFRGQRVAEECVKLFVKELKGALVPEGRLSNNFPQYLVRQSVQCDTFIISSSRTPSSTMMPRFGLYLNPRNSLFLR